jgi:hypothetical protein
VLHVLDCSRTKVIKVVKSFPPPLATAPKIYYPGTVVTSSGVYRVQHSMNHHSDSDTYIEAGLFLPHCNILGCHVHYSFVQPIAYETQKCQPKHTLGNTALKTLDAVKA